MKNLTVTLAMLLPASTCLAQDFGVPLNPGPAPGAGTVSGQGLLTPSSNGYNEWLPDRYRNLIFTLRNNDWQDQVRLPINRQHHGYKTIVLQNRASSPNHLHVRGNFAHLPEGVDRMMLPAGTTLSVDNRSNRWNLLTENIRTLNGPNEARWRIPSNGRKLATTLNLRDGQHVSLVGLPDGAHPYDTVTVRHTASWPSTVIAADTLFPRSNPGSSPEMYITTYSIPFSAGGSWTTQPIVRCSRTKHRRRRIRHAPGSRPPTRTSVTTTWISRAARRTVIAACSRSLIRR
ncbi:TPA: hypothetical protein ACGY72_000761 [Stenotrophomonas maltophilia]